MAKRKKKKADKPIVTADMVLRLLLKRHEGDLCVPECKGGPTWTRRAHERMDLWTMARSYAKPRHCAYEIKVTRSDFLNDKKWMAYLEFCNEFYFVVAPDVMSDDEVPEQAGLIVASQNGTTLFTKKKAPYRSTEIPDSIFKYVLVSRTEVATTHDFEHRRGSGKRSIKYWKNWLAEKEEKREIGYNVSGKLRKILKEKVDEVGVENHRLEKEIEKYAALQEFLESIGLNIHSWSIERDIEKKLEELNAGVPLWFRDRLRQLKVNIDKVVERMEEETASRNTKSESSSI